MAGNDDYSLHTRTVKSKKHGERRIYYAQFRLPDGSWSNAKSTGIIDQGRKRDRDQAIRWCIEYLKRGTIVTKEKTTFGAYADGFFDWENGSYAKRKRLYGHRLSKPHCDKMQGVLKRYAVPALGDLQLSAITGAHIEKLQQSLIDKGLTGGTVNHATTALRIVLKHAKLEGLIQAVPEIRNVAQGDQNERGIFTRSDVATILNAPWPDHRTRTAFIIAIGTGMRASEIAGLQDRHVLPDHIRVDQSWKGADYGTGPTKTGRVRMVPLAGFVRDAIVEIQAANPWPPAPERFVIYSQWNDRPLAPETYNRHLLEVLDGKKIDRKGRNLTFHSARHTFNSNLIDHRLPLQTIQQITGHLSDSMTQRYYHLTAQAIETVTKAVEASGEEKPGVAGKKHSPGDSNA